MEERQPSGPTPLDPKPARYSRQVLFSKIGAEGQQRLSESRVTLIGCGALGTVLASTLVRAGVGYTRICDRDFIELDNLQRQVLFDEFDIADDLPKAEAATRKLTRINSEVTVESVVTDVNYTNIERLAEGADLLLDGTDNFETRYLINDLAVKTGRPWIYGAVIGSTGLCMTIVPGQTPCLRCVFDEAPPAEMNPTCDTAGVLGPAVNLVASLQATEALKILSANVDQINRKLLHLDVWTGELRGMTVASPSGKEDCVCCSRREFPYLSGEKVSSATTLCGRSAVQVNVDRASDVDFERVAEKLSSVANKPVRFNRFMLKAEIDAHEISLFPDGRAIIKGTDDPDKARTLYAKYIGA